MLPDQPVFRVARQETGHFHSKDGLRLETTKKKILLLITMNACLVQTLNLLVFSFLLYVFHIYPFFPLHMINSFPPNKQHEKTQEDKFLLDIVILIVALRDL